MAVDQNQPGRRQHYNRGRRGPDRRGSDRRTAVTQETPARGADQVDVEQIMRDIRARIAQRSGIELSTQQIQELAARRLEAILDPRAVSPSLMQQLQRGAAAAPDVPAPSMEPPYSFEAETLYESHRGLLRLIRRLLNPLLKLFFNPTPIVHALHTQARLNREAAAREAERERIQREWNALHYEILQHLVTDVSRVSVEMQALMLRVEALTARIDFADRRVRTLEAGAPAGTPRSARPAEASPAAAPSAAAAATSAASATTAAAATAADTTAADAGGTEAASAEASRRRRRRRRGRRGGAGADAAATIVVGGSEGLTGPDAADLTDADEGDEEENGGPAVPAAPDADAVESPSLRPETGGGQSADAPPGDAATASTTSVGEPEPHLPVREGLAQGAPPPPQPPDPEPGPAPAWPEPAAFAPENAPAGTRSEPEASTAAPPPPAPVPTPPPDEPTPEPEPRDPGPTDR